MKILFIITQSEMGGAQRFLFNFLSRISGRYELAVATGSDGGDELTEKLRSLNIETFRLEKLKREISPVSDLKAVFETKELIEKFRPDDVFLLSTKAGFVGSFAAKMAKRANPGLRVIYRIGGWTFNDPWPKWKKKLWIILEKKSAAWKNIIIVNNRHDLEQAKKLGIRPKDALALVHNGIDPYKLNLLPPDEARLKIFEKISRKSGKIFQAETIIGTLANLYPPKGIDVLIETAEYFRKENVIFVVIGGGPLRDELEIKIKNSGLEKKFFILGQIPDGHKLLPAFDIFVLPSVKEGFPFAILEAMAAKLPVIATRIGSVPEMIESGKNGFIVEPGNPAALAGKIKDLIRNDHLRKEFSIQGHQTLLFNFTEDKMVKETEALL